MKEMIDPLRGHDPEVVNHCPRLMPKDGEAEGSLPSPLGWVPEMKKPKGTYDQDTRRA